MTLRVLVADDEPPARRKLVAHLRQEDGVEVAGEAGDGPAAVEAIQRLAPDLLFLDVQMPGMSGFEVIEAVGADRMPPVVFVTAYDQYAVEAFEVEAIDYLLKPFSAARFRQAFERVRRRLAERTSPAESLARLLQEVRPGARPVERIVGRLGEKIVLVPVADVTHLAAEGNYVRVHAAGRSYLIRDTLSRLESRLDPQRFARIHRSVIVNVACVQELQPHFHGDYVVLLRSGERLRLSRRYQDRLLGEQG